MNRRRIRLPAMQEKMGGVSASTIWRRVRDGTLPEPRKFCGITTWDEAEVDQRLGLAEPESAEAG